MKKHTIVSLKTRFDAIVKTTDDEEVEFWYARDLMPLFGYLRWENFEVAVGILFLPEQKKGE
jgi:DNA-damage-inducible protein D